jgi:hypothetical protein
MVYIKSAHNEKMLRKLTLISPELKTQGFYTSSYKLRKIVHAQALPEKNKNWATGNFFTI